MSILLIIPVILASYFRGAFAGIFLSALLPIIHFLMLLTFNFPNMDLESINVAIKILLFSSFALISEAFFSFPKYTEYHNEKEFKPLLFIP
ncbi:MAG: hypothetical protein HQK79_19670 [Desulfobacterales bacterium]|nr:hypothetical protein [Desulfobacterales bacterium]MBF0398039.1 hypothetical protein [Desulfobacterales bacterium]